MWATCPLWHTPHQNVREIISRIWDGYDIAHTPKSKDERYALFAYLIDVFYTKQNTWINECLNTAYIPWMNREDYISTLHEKFRFQIEKVIITETLNGNWEKILSGMITMFYILRAIFHARENISQEECLKICRLWMREVSIESFNYNSSKWHRQWYQGFVERLLSGQVYEKWEYELNCPALYTKWWNEFLESVISSVYQHFPQSKK